MLNMDIRAEKLDLIEWIAQISDASVIREIKAIKKEKEADWWDALSANQKEDIEAGLVDLDQGRKKPFSKVISKYK
jgi:hypothetical protein